MQPHGAHLATMLHICGYASLLSYEVWEPDVQGPAKRRPPGLVNPITALAYHFCLALHAAFTQPEDHLLADSCTDTLCLGQPF